MAYKAGMAAGKGNSERSQRLSAEAQQWKNLALMKVGTKMKIEQRQFIGDHPVVRQRIEDIIGVNFKELEQMWAANRKAMYGKYYYMFQSYAPNNRWDNQGRLNSRVV
jgi:hypothetical protein